MAKSWKDENRENSVAGNNETERLREGSRDTESNEGVSAALQGCFQSSTSLLWGWNDTRPHCSGPCVSQLNFRPLTSVISLHCVRLCVCPTREHVTCLCVSSTMLVCMLEKWATHLLPVNPAVFSHRLITTGENLVSGSSFGVGSVQALMIKVFESVNQNIAWKSGTSSSTTHAACTCPSWIQEHNFERIYIYTIWSCFSHAWL